MKHTALTVAAAIVLASSAAAAEEHDARVRAWIVNPSGEVDGVLLSDRATVRFSEMTGRSVASHVRVGERVQISRDGMTLVAPRTGWSVDIGMGALAARGGGPSSLPAVARAERSSGDGMTVSSGGPTGSQEFTVQGRVAGLTYTRGHMVDGVVIQGGITVRVSTTRGEALSSLRPGDQISVEGQGVRGAHGIGIRAIRVRDGRGTTLVGGDAN